MIGYGWPLGGEAKKVHDIERQWCAHPSILTVTIQQDGEQSQVPRQQIL